MAIQFQEFLLHQLRVEICSKALLAERGKLPLQFPWLAGPSTCLANLLNKGELHCEDSEQGRILFCLLIAIFCQIHLQLAKGQVVISHATTSVHLPVPRPRARSRVTHTCSCRGDR